MGKKESQKKGKRSKNEVKVKLDALDQSKIKKNSGQLKQFLWQCLKKNKISMKTESVLRQYVNKVSGDKNIPSELDEMLNESRLYSKTRQIFQGLSLKEKYSNLLQGNMEQVRISQRERLSESENELLREIKRVYRKYKVNSMFRESIVKEIQDCDEELDELVRKGYLKEIGSKQNPGLRILFLAC